MRVRKTDDRKVLADHYGIPESSVTDQDIADEKASLMRKHAKGSLDDVALLLFVRLNLDVVKQP